MHEMGLITDLIKKIETVAREQNAEHVLSASVWLGALSHISAEHFRGHFVEAAHGTVAEGARLDIEVSTDVNAAHAQDILLTQIEVETAVSDEP